jgi:hypothetical protein
MWRSVWILLALLAIAPRRLFGEPLAERLRVGLRSDGHAPFDLAHWLPNMPRGHEDS